MGEQHNNPFIEGDPVINTKSKRSIDDLYELMASQATSFHNDFVAQKTLLQGFIGKLDGIESRQEFVSGQSSKALKKATANEIQIERMRQSLLSSCVVIAGIPYSRGFGNSDLLKDWS